MKNRNEENEIACSGKYSFCVAVRALRLSVATQSLRSDIEARESGAALSDQIHRVRGRCNRAASD